MIVGIFDIELPLKFIIDADDCVMTFFVKAWITAGVIWSGLDLEFVLIGFVDVFAEKLQNVEEVSDMAELALCDGLTWDMIKIILKYFPNDGNDALYFLGVGLGTFTESEQLYHGLREDDFADFEVNLIVFEDIDLVNAPLDTDVLKDGNN